MLTLIDAVAHVETLECTSVLIWESILRKWLTRPPGQWRANKTSYARRLRNDCRSCLRDASGFTLRSREELRTRPSEHTGWVVVPFKFFLPARANGRHTNWAARNANR